MEIPSCSGREPASPIRSCVHATSSAVFSSGLLGYHWVGVTCFQVILWFHWVRLGGFIHLSCVLVLLLKSLVGFSSSGKTAFPSARYWILRKKTGSYRSTPILWKSLFNEERSPLRQESPYLKVKQVSLPQGSAL